MMKSTFSRIAAAMAIAVPLCFAVSAQPVAQAQPAAPVPAQPVAPAPLPATLPPGAVAPAPAVPMAPAAPAQGQPAASVAPSEPAVQAEDLGGAGITSDESAARIDAENKLRRGTELSVQALASAPFLFFERDAKGHLRPGNARIEPTKDKAAYQRFDKVLVRPTGKAALEYKVGDTVDILTHDGLIKFKGGSAQLITRRGRGVVEEYVEKRAAVKIIEMWGIVRGGESILPTTKFEPIFCDNLVVPETEVNATVIFRLNETVTPYLHQHFIIDKGETDGVKLGDFFIVKDKVPKGELSEELLEAQVVSVTPSSATLVIQKLFKNRMKVGDHAILNRRPAGRKAAE